MPNIGNAQWSRLEANGKPHSYLHIGGLDQIHMDSSKNFGNKDFWNSINFNENKLSKTSSKLKEEL